MDGAAGLLHHARGLIGRGWTQHADARAGDGSVVHPWDSRAAKWSLLGALVAAVEHTAASQGEHAAIRSLAHTCALLADILDTDSLERWNDSTGRTGNEVSTALDRALAERTPDSFPGFTPN
jgi:hypothetical protein